MVRLTSWIVRYSRRRSNQLNQTKHHELSWGVSSKVAFGCPVFFGSLRLRVSALKFLIERWKNSRQVCRFADPVLRFPYYASATKRSRILLSWVHQPRY